MVYFGKMLSDQGVNVIFAATAHRRIYRTWGRQATEAFKEVYVRCSLETCRKRDKKGIYHKAETGEASSVPGIQEPYEVPEQPDIIVDTEQETKEVSVRKIVSTLEKQRRMETN